MKREQATMEKNRAWMLCRLLPAISPGETVAMALETLALQGVQALPVVEGAAASGYVTRTDLLILAGGLAEWCANPGAASQISCRNAVRPFGAAIHAEATTIEMGLAFDQTGAPLLPVTADGGRVIGYLTPADVLAPAERRITLPSTGGMATPFGVYLTADGISGGVGPWALVATGLFMGIRAVIVETFTPWAVRMAEGGSVTGHWLRSWEREAPGVYAVAIQLFELFLFLLLIRLSALAGYHAAEHQTVHTLEAGEPLTPDRVRRQPRVHPRCGTNLMIMVSMAGCLGSYVALQVAGNPEIGQTLLPLGIVFIFMFRLSIGGFVQQYFTTRQATDKQIASGIRAAQELLANYARSGNQPRPFWRKLWAVGLAQVGVGMVSVLFLADWLRGMAAHVRW
ncbi:MAG: DUF1385 domain-containing protein [Armatimonadota bacterium]|nr:DUF1385 domain-containing protein [Armatimonadota bacterium]